MSVAARSLLDDLEAAFPDVGEVTVPGLARPIRIQKPPYGGILKLRTRVLRETAEIEAAGESKDLPQAEQHVRTLAILDVRARFEVDLVRACVVGQFEEGERRWTDDRIRHFLERISKPDGENPLVKACEIAAGLGGEEVGGEDDPFGSPSGTDGA